ncbi:Uncharacterised protein [Bordetella pertussis]|nr:Uncharacterised protein [Bordetella pertussis]CPJ33965.1 Uncharacterised protein [Bordetella pertussis]CPJ45193.1 Uncharacterised protein [Bordetella pertussis]
MPHSNYARHLMGSATIDPTGAFEAGSFASFTLTYTAGYFGIDDTGSIKIVHRFASDMGKPQFTDPQGWNYTTVEAGNGAVLHVEYDGKRNIRPWDKTLFIRVVRGYLEEGEQIIVRFGDTRQGSPGMRVQTFHEPTFEFKVLWWTLSPRTTMSRSRPRRRSPWWPAPLSGTRPCCPVCRWPASRCAWASRARTNGATPPTRRRAATPCAATCAWRGCPSPSKWPPAPMPTRSKASSPPRPATCAWKSCTATGSWRAATRAASPRRRRATTTGPTCTASRKRPSAPTPPRSSSCSRATAPSWTR